MAQHQEYFVVLPSYRIVNLAQAIASAALIVIAIVYFQNYLGLGALLSVYYPAGFCYCQWGDLRLAALFIIQGKEVSASMPA